MPKIVYPRSDAGRIALLDQCFSNVKTITKTESQLLPPNIIPKIKELKDEYLAIYDEMITSYADLGMETREKSEVITDLNITVRDFFEVLRRRKVRMKLHPEIFTMYGLHLDGRNPKLTQQSDLLCASDSIVIGDANAVKEGYSPMQNPSAEEVATLMVKARKELGDIGYADRQYNQLQKRLQVLRTTINELIREIAAQLRFALRNNSPSNQRRIMRHYGFEYRFDKNETEK
jgi:hypothetical protein